MSHLTSNLVYRWSSSRAANQLGRSLPMCSSFRWLSEISFNGTSASHGYYKALYSKAFWSLLEDRRACYRDSVVLDKLIPHRQKFSQAVRLHLCVPPDYTLSSSERIHELLLTAPERLLTSNTEAVETFYADVLLSDLVCTASELTQVFQAIVSIQSTAIARSRSRWSPALYTAAMQSLIALTAHSLPSADTTVFGEKKQVERAQLGESSGVFMGHALQAFDQSSCGCHSMDAVWSAFFVVCGVAQVSPKLLDLWWKKMLTFYSERNEETLPYEAVHAVLAATADNMDIKRSLQVFHLANKRGTRVVCPDTTHSDASSAVAQPFNLGRGALTIKAEDTSVQLLQIRLLAKLMASCKSSSADGGLRELVVSDVKRLIDPEVMLSVPWEVLNDILAGLSVPSAMQLVKARGTSNGSDGSVPFMIWASLLRRCARDHMIEEAEALFSFIPFRFPLEKVERQELVAIMMRLYATLTPADTASALHIFLEHAIRPTASPRGAQGVEPDESLYSLLARAAESRNARAMIFLEACAAGIDLSAEIFEALTASEAHSSVRSLNKKLPYQYSSSRLDAMLQIPRDVDAHLRREEAQNACGKPVVDSTGDVT